MNGLELRAAQITIAVTVYNRRDFVLQAIDSALHQTVPVKVIVVEDCGPDPTLPAFIQDRFGARVDYFRNPRTRGLFDNWNACLEYCQTPWLSILHDDDYLRPNYVAAMLSLARRAPDRAVYFCRVATLDGGREWAAPAFATDSGWRDIDLTTFAQGNPVYFPGQLLRVEVAKAVGGFRATSVWAGDWEMWFKLSLRGGNAQTSEEVAVMRSHYSPGRGTTKIELSGKKWVLDNVQCKRNLALLKQAGRPVPFQREKFLEAYPLPATQLLKFARGYARGILVYNTYLFLRSPPPHWRYAFFQWAVRLFGAGFVRWCSKLWNLMGVRS